MRVRELLRLTTNLIDICYDCRIRVGSSPVNDDLIIEQTSDRLSDLRDILEKVFKATIAGVHLPGMGPLVDEVYGVLLKCRNELNELEAVLKQEDGRKRIEKSSSWPDFEVTLTTLATNTTSLRGILDTERR